MTPADLAAWRAEADARPGYVTYPPGHIPARNLGGEDSDEARRRILNLWRGATPLDRAPAFLPSRTEPRLFDGVTNQPRLFARLTGRKAKP